MESPRRNITKRLVPKLLPTGSLVAEAEGCGAALADGVESTTAEYVNVYEPSSGISASESNR
jgi:hypothetical protein